MAKKKVTGKQLEMSFNSSAKTSNGGRAKRANVIKSPAAPKKPTPPTPPAKATPPAAPKKATPPKAPNTGTSPATAVKKSNTYVKDRVKRTDALRAKTFTTEAEMAKRKVDKLRTGNPANNKGKAALDLVKKTSKAGKAGKAALMIAGATLVGYGAAKAKKAYDNQPKKTGVENAARKAAVLSTVKKPDTKKNPTKKATNLPEVTVTAPKKTTSTSNNTSIEQKAKDVMSGKYGNGAARKTALGADYDKVQAIINKQMASSKPKTAPAKTVTAPAAPEKMEIKKAQPIEYKGPTELAIPKPVVKEEPSRMEQKREDRKEAKGYRKEAKEDAKKEKMRKGGQVLPKAQYGKIVKTAANYIKPAMGAAKSATKSAKIGVKQLSDKYKKAKVDSYNKKTANLRRSEDWDKFYAAESDKKLRRALVGIAGGSTVAALYPNKKKSKKK